MGLFDFDDLSISSDKEELKHYAHMMESNKGNHLEAKYAAKVEEYKAKLQADTLIRELKKNK